MASSSAARSSLCLLAIPLLAVATNSRASTDEFFKITLSNGGRKSYLYGEEVSVAIEVSNPWGKPLKYMRQGSFIAQVEVLVFHDGSALVPTAPAANPWGDVHWVKGMVAELDRDPLRRRFSVSKFYGALRNGALDSGRYKVVARLTQNIDEFGLARGTAASNEINFTVTTWEAKRVSERTMERGLIKTRVQLVETTGGEFLVCWRDMVRNYETTRVVPIDPIDRIQDVLWAANESRCYILGQKERAAASRIVIVDREASSVASLPLDRF